MTEQDIKVMFSKYVLEMPDKAKEHNTIDWQEAYEVMMTNMPELKSK